MRNRSKDLIAPNGNFTLLAKQKCRRKLTCELTSTSTSTLHIYCNLDSLRSYLFRPSRREKKLILGFDIITTPGMDLVMVV
jgi:hypothetical protein